LLLSISFFTVHIPYKNADRLLNFVTHFRRQQQNKQNDPVTPTNLLFIIENTESCCLYFLDLSGEEIEYTPTPTDPNAAAEQKNPSDEAVN
jgi:hypothetical protein